MSLAPLSPRIESGRATVRGLLGRLSEVGQVLVPGAYAWAVTVLPCAWSRGASSLSSFAALMALGGLVAGSLLMRDRPKLGSLLGIWLFVFLCLGTWLLNRQALHIDRIDPVRAGSGTLGWLLYALGWGVPWRPGVHPEDNPRARLHPKLEPRRLPLLRMPVVVATAGTGAVLGLLFAWRTADPARALMLQGIALAAGIGGVTSAARAVLAQGRKHTPPTLRQRVTHAFPWLAAAVTLLIMALVCFVVK